MAWYKDYKEALGAVIFAAWPELAENALSIKLNMQKRNWTNLLDTSQLAPPWVVVDISPQPTSDWGVGAPRYLVGVTVFRVEADQSDPDDESIDEYLFDRMSVLLQALYEATSLGTVLTENTPNANDDNPINMSMLTSDQSFSSGSLMFTSVVVDVGDDT